ncbi:MAG: T9SS type A sorting domain-containing protein [Syntrophothermus sp.]
MKTLFSLFLMAMLFFTVANANQNDTLLISEDFTVPTLGDISGQDGWVKSGGPSVKVANTNPLTFFGYNSGDGQYAIFDTNSSTSGRTYKLLNDTTYSVTDSGTTIYYSLLLRVNKTFSAASNQYFFSIGQGSNYFGKLFAKYLTDTTYQIGVSKLSNTASFVTREMKIGQTYLVVVRYNILNNAINLSNNTCYMWIDLNSNIEPDTTTAEAKVFAGAPDYNATYLTTIMFHNRGVSTPLFAIDGIRVAASSVTSLQAWNDLNPGPLPVELTSLTASSVNGKVVLTWQTASETNNRGFQVERKSSNNNWVSLGFVAGNGTSTITNSYSFTDNTANGTYSYRLKQVDFNGSYKYSDVIEVVNGLPVEFTLSQNYPNPFNPNTTIEFSVVKAGNYNLDVYNVSGEKVASLLNSNLTAGNHKVNFDASRLTSGIYFYRLSGEGVNLVNKMTLLK